MRSSLPEAENTSELIALTAWEADRRLGYAAIIYAILILVGSVHLGWHYAIDGYVSIAGMLAIWGAVGWFVRRHPPAKPCPPQ